MIWTGFRYKIKGFIYKKEKEKRITKDLDIKLNIKI
jgi:hypothetical protein